MQMPRGRSSQDPLTVPGRESVEGAGLGTEPEVWGAAWPESGAVGWPVLCKTAARPRVQVAQAGLERGTHFFKIT